MADRYPTVAHVAMIAESVRRLLSTFDQYRLFTEDAHNLDPGSMIVQLAMLDALQFVERTLNPLKFSWSNPQRRTFVVAHWVGPPMVAIGKVRSLTDAIIERWDVPEICDELQPIWRGTGVVYKQHDDNGNVILETKIDRPLRPRTLTDQEKDQLGWCLSVLDVAVQQALDTMTTDQLEAELVLPADLAGLMQIALVRTPVSPPNEARLGLHAPNHDASPPPPMRGDPGRGEQPRPLKYMRGSYAGVLKGLGGYHRSNRTVLPRLKEVGAIDFKVSEVEGCAQPNVEVWILDESKLEEELKPGWSLSTSYRQNVE